MKNSWTVPALGVKNQQLLNNNNSFLTKKNYEKKKFVHILFSVEIYYTPCTMLLLPVFCLYHWTLAWWIPYSIRAIHVSGRWSYGGVAVRLRDEHQQFIPKTWRRNMFRLLSGTFYFLHSVWEICKLVQHPCLRRMCVE